jgi:hypothetical protein
MLSEFASRMDDAPTPAHMLTPRHFAEGERFYGTQKLMLLLTLRRFAESSTLLRHKNILI